MNLFFLFCCFDQQWLTSSERKPSPASAIRESGFRKHNINYVGSMEMFWKGLQWSDCRITSLWTFLVAAFLLHRQSNEPTWPADSPSVMSPSVCGHWQLLQQCSWKLASMQHWPGVSKRRRCWGVCGRAVRVSAQPAMDDFTTRTYGTSGMDNRPLFGETSARVGAWRKCV